MRTILVGEAPPQWRMKDTPTSLPFSGLSGKRFSNMLGVDVTEAFETRNLISVWPGKNNKGSLFPLALARAGVRDLVRELEERYLSDLGSPAPPTHVVWDTGTSCLRIEGLATARMDHYHAWWFESHDALRSLNHSTPERGQPHLERPRQDGGGQEVPGR